MKNPAWVALLFESPVGSKLCQRVLVLISPFGSKLCQRVLVLIPPFGSKLCQQSKKNKPRGAFPGAHFLEPRGGNLESTSSPQDLRAASSAACVQRIAATTQGPAPNKCPWVAWSKNPAVRVASIVCAALQKNCWPSIYFRFAGPVRAFPDKKFSKNWTGNPR